MRIENTLFVQLLVGGRLEREGINAKFLSLMALITLALAPVALLLMFEIKFLPYHSEKITWLHRGLLALDLALVWTLWPGYRSGWGVRLRPKKTSNLRWPRILSAAALAYAVVVATFPDEPIYVATIWLHLVSENFPVSTLYLGREDLIDDAKLAHILEKNEANNESSTGVDRWVATMSLFGRDLTGADLREADVRHVDFSYAILNRADLRAAWAKNAYFIAAQLQGASLDNAQLQGASLDSAQLQGALLRTAQLQGASLGGAQLQGASLEGAQLQGASLSLAQLQGASLGRAQLQGADLFEAQLQGASLDGAQLQGASLKGAQLQGASLKGARLQGASLDGARLQGASLKGAQLQGAWLDGARLQGASLNGAQLQGASFENVCAWRADARQAVWRDTRVELPKADKMHECDLTAASFAELRKLIAENVPKRDLSATMERIEPRIDPTKALEGEDEMAKDWTAREHETLTPDAYAKNLAGQRRELGCAAEGAPYVLHGLVFQLSFPEISFSEISPFRDQGDAAKALAAAFLDEAHCPGAHGLSEADKAKLKKIAAPAAPQAPKP